MSERRFTSGEVGWIIGFIVGIMVGLPSSYLITIVVLCH
jgi:hypothetical protein